MKLSEVKINKVNEIIASFTEVSKEKCEEYVTLLTNHDLTFQFSDDSRAYKKGFESFNRIKAFNLPKELKKQLYEVVFDNNLSMFPFPS